MLLAKQKMFPLLASTNKEGTPYTNFDLAVYTDIGFVQIHILERKGDNQWLQCYTHSYSPFPQAMPHL